MKSSPRWFWARTVIVSGLVVCVWWGLAPARSRACTSLALNNSHTVFGTNYDNSKDQCLIFINTRGLQKTGLSTGTTGELLRWTSKYSSVTFDVGGYQLPWAGMNEKGLMLSTMQLNETSPPEADERPPLDYGPLWMQYVLDTCATVEDVIATDARVRIDYTVDHYLVADRFGGAAVVEFLDGEMVVHSGDALPVAALTNHLYEDSVATWTLYREAGDDDYSNLDSSLRRFCMAADQVSSFQPTESETAVEIAFAALDAVAGPDTQMSIVFDTGGFRTYFKTLAHQDVRVVDLRDFGLYCNSPVQMLDIHTNASGNVNSLFEDLSIPACIDHMERYLAADNQDVPPGAIEGYHEVVGNFQCNGPRRGIRRLP